MKSIRERSACMFCVYINMIVCFKVLKDSFSIMDFNFKHVTIVFLLAGAAWVLFIGVFNKRTRIAFVIALVLLSVYLIFFKFDSIGFLKKIMQDVSTINNQVIDNKRTSYSQYKSILMILVPAFAIVFGAIGEKFPNFILTFTLAVMILLWYGGWDGDVKKSLFAFVFVSLLTYGFNKYILESKKLTQGGVKLNTSYKIVICYICIFSIVIASITRVLPQEFKGKYGDSMVSKFENKFGKKTAEKVPGVKYSYGLRSSGYNDTDEKLGGPITINNLTAFKVKFEVKDNESRGFPSYFRGTIKDHYTGSCWKKSVENGFSETSSLLNVNYGTEAPLYSGNSWHVATIQPVEMRTSTLFIPKYVKMIKIGDPKEKLFGDNYGNYVSSNIVEKPYEIKYGVDNYKMVENTDDLLGEMSMIGNENEVIYYKQYKSQEYGEKYSKYLQLPDNITPRTKELVQQITNGKKTDKDKAKAIHDYLKSNYKYTLKVQEVPSDAEFLDYFLFTEKKGYCTYFATAATMMCRMAGIPARYVEGFHANFDKPASDDTYAVTNRGAHAWCEILVSPEKNAWGVLDCVPNAESLMVEEMKQDEGGSNGTSGAGTSAVKNNRKNIQMEEASQDSGEKVVPKHVKVIIGIGVAMAVVVLVILCASARFAVMKRRVVKSGSVIPLYNYTFKRLKSMGIVKSKGASDLEFADKIKDNQLKSRMKTLIEASYAEFYGNEASEGFNKNEHLRFIERYAKNKQGKLEYFLKKLIF